VQTAIVLCFFPSKVYSALISPCFQLRALLHIRILRDHFVRTRSAHHMRYRTGVRKTGTTERYTKTVGNRVIALTPFELICTESCALATQIERSP